LETSRDFSAKTQGHIHNYVYKVEGLLAKVPGRIGSEESNRSRAFSARFARHRKDLKITKKERGLDANRLGFLLPLADGGQEGHWPAGLGCSGG
jgi:hypothetical protein